MDSQVFGIISFCRRQHLTQSDSVEFEEVDDLRGNYGKSTKNRLTMRYDMHALKRIGEIEDSFRRRLGSMMNCDPDELPVDFDFSEVHNAGSSRGREILRKILNDVEVSGDIEALIEEACLQLDAVSK